MAQEIPYLVIIECENKITLRILYTGTKEGLEQEIKDFMYQEWCEAQPDITKYRVVNLLKEPDTDPMIKVRKISLQESLANIACAYADKFNFVGY